MDQVVGTRHPVQVSGAQAEAVDTPQLRGTYFGLRAGLVACSLLVLAAPVSQAVFGDGWPPSISDSFYTRSGGMFVIGLVAASAMLLVIRADTLSETTLLHVAGGLGLVVAGVATTPQGPDGSERRYPAWLADTNEYTLWALLVVGLAASVGSFWYPKEIRTWNAEPRTARVLLALPSALLLAGLVVLVAAPEAVAEKAHTPAAVAMFALLGTVATLRTTFGVDLLEKLGDYPLADTPLANRRARSVAARAADPSARMNRFDIAYAAVACIMAATIVAALGVLSVHWTIAAELPDHWVSWVEFILLITFDGFWVAQTVEAWQDLSSRRG
jgi:hypothetical protein